ncbi:hypothetical protein J2127_000301 [Methanococcus voltae]|uniref:hypothetical protein n=1 Tax=Methanococcus voltae TaxID=2188 RepID=UPI001FDA9FAD|nr:hypothetical protein [Methanococcus voltae]MBP2143160.1 hypothetical protein [Methanococcus voltae]
MDVNLSESTNTNLESLKNLKKKLNVTELRAKSIEELVDRLDELNEEEEGIYLNKELTKSLIIELLEVCDVEEIYLPVSKYNRTNKKILEALGEIGITVKPLMTEKGRPTTKKGIIKKQMEEGKTPKEIASTTGINLKTVEYHYYKLKNK